MMQPYKTPGEVIPILGLVEVKEHAGPREKCPVCGSVGHGVDASYPYSKSLLTANIRACSGVSWLRRLFGGCARQTVHLHQWCRACGGKWTCAPLEHP